MRSRRSEDGEPISVLDRSLVMLTAFRQDELVLSSAELCRRTGLPKSTAHRIIGELVSRGMLDRGPDGVRLGMRLFELGQLALNQRGIRTVAAPFLAELGDATGQVVHLGVLSGAEVMYIDKIDTGRGMAFPSRVGGRMPAYCTGLGKALLAYAPTEVVMSVLCSDLPRRTPRTMVAPGHLIRELERIRQTGIAAEHEESFTGIVCVAAPVFDASGSAVAAVSVAGHVHRVRADRLVPLVRNAAHGISRALRDSFVPAD
ncbi:IclR family transcriptional regulator [Dactylosporangium sp. NPDC051485]|uniref:IclR family transcriptional regulator n=1 Tax=Dactylosporangium sp. NPDC051485 TaxID=3154846 RepID=UPI00341A892F